MSETYARENGFKFIPLTMPVPTLSSVESSGRDVIVKWKKLDRATSYRVYRKLSGGSWKLLSTVSTLSYTDPTPLAGSVYSYKVKAKVDGVWTEDSNVITKRHIPFTDVSMSDSYFDEVNWAVNNNIISGTSKTTFSPDAPCTRYQLAVMLYKMAGKPAVSGVKLPFTDVAANASYYNAVCWAYSQGIISGTSKTTFSPNANITRYQVVQMLYKMAGRPSVSGTLPFKDVSTKASYYKAVLWAVQNNITKGTNATHFSPKAECKRYQMVVFLYKYNRIYHFVP